MSAYTRGKVKSKYRNRIRLERTSSDVSKPHYERIKRCRKRKKASAAVDIRFNDSAKSLTLDKSLMWDKHII